MQPLEKMTEFSCCVVLNCVFSIFSVFLSTFCELIPKCSSTCMISTKLLGNSLKMSSNTRNSSKEESKSPSIWLSHLCFWSTWRSRELLSEIKRKVTTDSVPSPPSIVFPHFDEPPFVQMGGFSQGFAHNPQKVSGLLQKVAEYLLDKGKAHCKGKLNRFWKTKKYLKGISRKSEGKTRN